MSNTLSERFSAYKEDSATRQLLHRLADKWALLILDRLNHSPARFHVLCRDINGITHTLLSKTLKNLERDGLVTRTVLPTAPVSVEYSLTELGLSLRPVTALIKWTEKHILSVQSAQKNYEFRAVGGVNAQLESECD